MAMAMATAFGDEALARVEEATRDAHRLQLRTLRSILRANASVGYLRRYLQGHILPLDPSPAGGDDSGRGDADLAAAYRRLVPLSSYEQDYAELIGSIAEGVEAPTALSFEPLFCFFNSSGTSSIRPKLIPFFDSALAKSASAIAHQASSTLLRRLTGPLPSDKKILWFLYGGNVTETTGGFKVMAASAYPFQGKATAPSPLFSMCVSPAEVVLASDTSQQMYCHLLCGLRSSSSIDGIRAPYAAGLARAIYFLESKWTMLCDDIESGTVSSEITEVGMREAVQQLLAAPQPELAKRIRDVCSRKNWGGILRELWPELRYVSCVSTGTMEQYYSVLKHYAGDSVQLLGGDYFASECAVGINMDKTRPPDQTSYALLPFAAYFEFLPFELESCTLAEETVDIQGLHVGKMYEVVVSTHRGLYRYRLGDIVKVVGFHNSSPLLQFVTRSPRTASETFTERSLMYAMNTFEVMISSGMKGQVVEYAAGFAESHVIIFVEVSKDSMFLRKERLEESVAQIRRCCELLEGCLGSLYKAKRDNKDLGTLHVSIVAPGSFDELARLAMESGAPASQYKPPKIIRKSNLIDSLKSSAVITASSESEYV